MRVRVRLRLTVRVRVRARVRLRVRVTLLVERRCSVRPSATAHAFAASAC